MATTDLRYRRCPDCDVLWHRDHGEDCWVCANPGLPSMAPVIANQHGFVAALTDRQWAEIRTEIGAA